MAARGRGTLRSGPMPTLDPRVDAYIARAAPFAQPILAHLRAVVHAACPDVTETIKWGMPYFERRGPFGHMAAFSEHCSFGLRRGEVIEEVTKDGMGQLGRIRSLADLPSDEMLTGWLRAAAALDDAGAPRARAAKPEVEVPAALLAALDAAGARAAFDAMAPGYRREYATWIAGAKGEATRERRLAQAVAQIAEGKPQSWKYGR